MTTIELATSSPQARAKGLGPMPIVDQSTEFAGTSTSCEHAQALANIDVDNGTQKPMWSLRCIQSAHCTSSARSHVLHSHLDVQRC